MTGSCTWRCSWSTGPRCPTGPLSRAGSSPGCAAPTATSTTPCAPARRYRTDRRLLPLPHRRVRRRRRPAQERVRVDPRRRRSRRSRDRRAGRRGSGHHVLIPAGCRPCRRRRCLRARSRSRRPSCRQRVGDHQRCDVDDDVATLTTSITSPPQPTMPPPTLASTCGPGIRAVHELAVPAELGKGQA